MFSKKNSLVDFGKTINQYLILLQDGFICLAQVLRLRNEDFDFW